MIRPGSHRMELDVMPGATRFVFRWLDKNGNEVEDFDAALTGEARGFDDDNNYVGMFWYYPRPD